jgi:hypothetical protein
VLKAVETTKPKGKIKEEITFTGQSPRNREACHSFGTALLQIVTKIV